MRIALRTSGGRGEYEVAGSHGKITLSDMFDTELVVQVIPGVSLSTGNVLRKIQGKPRIRLLKPNTDEHIYLTLANTLLMPKPKRELGATPAGKLQLTDNNYSVSSIQIDVDRITAGKTTIIPTDLVLENSTGDIARLDIVERIRILFSVWEIATNSIDELSLLLQDHKRSVESANILEMKRYADRIRKKVDFGDPLREILRHYDVLDEFTYWMGLHFATSLEEIVTDNVLDPKSAIQSRVKRWREQTVRGYGARMFSDNVKAAYNSTCLFSGDHLPKSEHIPSSGVDSAHILPWARYDLNQVSNGLCLNKLCHWAFDNGVLKLDFKNDSYILSLTQSALLAENAGKATLDYFRSLTGNIPVARLPTEHYNRPSPEFLQLYNSQLPE